MTIGEQLDGRLDLQSRNHIALMTRVATQVEVTLKQATDIKLLNDVVVAQANVMTAMIDRIKVLEQMLMVNEPVDETFFDPNSFDGIG